MRKVKKSHFRYNLKRDNIKEHVFKENIDSDKYVRLYKLYNLSILSHIKKTKKNLGSKVFIKGHKGMKPSNAISKGFF